MTARELILKRAAKNKPAATPLPDLTELEAVTEASVQQFAEVFATLGGRLYPVQSYAQVLEIISKEYPAPARVISTVTEIAEYVQQPDDVFSSGHALENVELAVIKAHFAVAENAAVWVTEAIAGNRAVPFICQHLAVIVNKSDIVPTMHRAYLHPAQGEYNYGVFISGPSKTADIEQSLVLGAHGPKSMMVFLMEQ